MASDFIDTSTGCSREASTAAQNKRKEKARIAARARRSQEANIIMDMANELHISQEKMRRIDKATIVKLAIDYIKAFEILCRCKTTTAPTFNTQRIISSIDQQHYNHNINNENINHLNSVLPAATIPVACSTNSSSGGGNNNNNCTNPNNTSNTSNDTKHDQPKISTISIFVPKTEDVDSHFLLLETRNGCAALVPKPDDQIDDNDDLTHLAPQAGDTSISLEVEPLDGIMIDTSLFNSMRSQDQSAGSPPLKPHLQFSSPLIGHQHTWSTV